MTTIRRTGWTALAALLLAGCAAPRLKLYTLGAPPVRVDATPLPGEATVIEVDRLILPDDVDSEDILLRDGNLLERSPTGRWASPLSVLATDLVTSRLARRAPDALVTDQWPAESTEYQITIHVARLDVTGNGLAVMDADWQILAGDSEKRAIRDRVEIRLAGPTTTDQDVVRLETALFERLADAIVIPGTQSLGYSNLTTHPEGTHSWISDLPRNWHSSPAQRQGSASPPPKL
ncbi:MAG: ABC-type transport auxiliary lipoprotein family protein [Steroidobacteraceae bacterium]